MGYNTEEDQMEQRPRSRYPDEPRSMRYPHVQQERQAMLKAGYAHMAPLIKYAAEMRAAGNGFELPDFDPLDGGADAEVLLLLEKPGPKTSAMGGSTFISRNNNDQTAANFFRFMQEVGMPREMAVTWNAIPYWDGKIKFNASDRREGRRFLGPLLSVLPNLKAIVLVGLVAWQAEEDVRRLTEGRRVAPKIFRSYHPSGQNWKNHDQIKATWATVKAFLDAS